MFFTVSKGVREMADSMVKNPHDWVQGQYEFVNTKHPDICIWTCNGVFFLKIGGNECLSLAEKFYLVNAIKRSMAQKLMTPRLTANKRAKERIGVHDIEDFYREET